MTKILIIVLATVAIIWLLKRAFSARKPPDAGDRARDASARGELVSCAHCGVNLPRGEAHAERGVPPGAGGREYCSEEHRRLGPREP